MFAISPAFARSRAVQALVAACLLTASGLVLAQVDASQCGALKGSEGQYGPFDYRFNKKELGIVERLHFPPGTESLLFKYDTYKNPPPGSYTLRAYPNHPRALMLLMNLGEKFKTDKVLGYELPVECYFERATRFAPDDVVVRMIYSMYLVKHERMQEAERQLALARTDAADNPFSHYNIGLLYFEMKLYKQALAQAHTAMALGMPRTELKERLQGAGEWQEPVQGQATLTNGNAATVRAGDSGSKRPPDQ